MWVTVEGSEFTGRQETTTDAQCKIVPVTSVRSGALQVWHRRQIFLKFSVFEIVHGVKYLIIKFPKVDPGPDSRSKHTTIFIQGFL